MLGFRHQPVLAAEVLELLAPVSGQIYYDGTVGGGGHAAQILEASSPAGRLIASDRDPQALQAAGQTLAPYGQRGQLLQGAFGDLEQLLSPWLSPASLDGMLLDLGVSSPQLDQPQRGFSLQQDGPLDMRMDPGQTLTAATIVNNWSPEDLTALLRQYGEIPQARRLVQAILVRRKQQPLDSTLALADLVQEVLPQGPRKKKGRHPATQVFQALRMAVNDELGQLERFLRQALYWLQPGGRLLVISFHSLEDRLVKRFFQHEAADCVCPPALPVCRCDKIVTLKPLTRRPVMAGPEERHANPRARSAVLRAAVRTGNALAKG